MVDVRDSPRYWRDRAEELKVKAATMVTPECKRALEGWAKTYTEIAERTERRLELEKTCGRHSNHPQQA